LFQLPDNRGKLIWAGGAMAWVVSQLFEAAEWGWGAETRMDLPGYFYLVFVEELLEMAGSSMFLLALLRLNRIPRAS
jgi:hypothetical protein